MILLSSLVIFTVWQIWIWGHTPRELLSLLLILPLDAAWALMVFCPIAGQWTLMVTCVLYLPLPIHTPELLQFVSPLVLCADGTIRKQKWLIIVTFASLLGLQWWHSRVLDGMFVANIMAFMFTIGLAWAARVIVEERELAREKAQNIKEETERLLAGAIHDTTARDLTRLVLRLKHWGEAEQARKHLEHTKITLIANIDSRVCDLPSAKTMMVIETVAELLSNAEKYASPHTEVELSLNLEGKMVNLFQSNHIGYLLETAAVSGGTGLQRLAYRLDNLGGNLDTSTIGTMWLVEAQIPLIPDLETLLKGQS
ncbi:histidine kinase [Mobiluncus mulieris]|uniref:histidine kinase n=1 Tax=Mobiluncus mulieris TaxID=2052 RepID=UPI0024323C5B|nr:histidine kinase [Mobiluncus mulieris]